MLISAKTQRDAGNRFIAMDEKDFLNLLTKGDPAALKYFFDENYTRLCMLAYRIVKDEDGAKDVVQDVFIRLWRNRADLAITGSMSSYLKKATINTALNFINNKHELNRNEARHRAIYVSSSNTTEEGLFQRELQQKITVAIGNLSQRTRSVFALVRFEDMSYKEVAETLHISVKAVEKEMMKALRLLREALKDDFKSK